MRFGNAVLQPPRSISSAALPNVPALARALGGDGVVIHDLSELRDEHLDRPGLFVIDARFTPTSAGGPLWMKQRSEFRSPRAKAKRHRLHHRTGFATDLPLNLDKSNV